MQQACLILFHGVNDEHVVEVRFWLGAECGIQATSRPAQAMFHFLARVEEVFGALLEPKPQGGDSLGGISFCLIAGRRQVPLVQELSGFDALDEDVYMRAQSVVNCERAGGPVKLRGVEGPGSARDRADEGHGPEARHKGLPFDLMVG